MTLCNIPYITYLNLYIFFLTASNGKIDLGTFDKITVASPIEPGTYELLEVKSNFSNPIRVDVMEFDLQNDGAFLSLLTGRTPQEVVEIARWTGSALPATLKSYRPYMWLNMTSYSSSTSKGFILSLTSPDEEGKHSLSNLVFFVRCIYSIKI